MTLFSMNSIWQQMSFVNKYVNNYSVIPFNQNLSSMNSKDLKKSPGIQHHKIGNAIFSTIFKNRQIRIFEWTFELCSYIYIYIYIYI